MVTQRKIANINVVSDSIPLIRTYGRIYLTNENAIIVDLAAEDLKFVVSSSFVLFVDSPFCGNKHFNLTPGDDDYWFVVYDSESSDEEDD